MSNIDSSPFSIWLDGILSVSPEGVEDFALEENPNISEDIAAGAESFSEQLIALLDNVEQPDLGSLIQSYLQWAFPTALAVSDLLAQAGVEEDYASCLPGMVERCPELQATLGAYLEEPQRELLIMLVCSWMAVREEHDLLLANIS